MKFLIMLVLATVLAIDLPVEEIQSRSIVVPVASPNDRISRGQNAAIERLAFYVRLLVKDNKNELSWCSGSLIGNEWILTAAHCTEDTKEAVVHLGGSHVGSAEIVHKVTDKNFIYHYDWNKNILKNDISLIKIPYTKFSERVQPVKLPAAGSFYHNYDGDEVLTTGWCRDSVSTGNIIRNLSSGYMSVIPNSQCRRYYGEIVRPSNICCGNYGGISSCIGDSGSPLILKATRTQIGLTSFGHRNASTISIPAVFTRINYYLDWINENTGVAF